MRSILTVSMKLALEAIMIDKFVTNSKKYPLQKRNTLLRGVHFISVFHKLVILLLCPNTKTSYFYFIFLKYIPPKHDLISGIKFGIEEMY